MQNEDTIKLLKECNASVKMAIRSLREVVEKTKQFELREIIQKSIEKHECIENKTQDLLKEYDEEGKEPNVLSDVMSWMKINVKYTIDPTDSEIANLVVDGCNMGIKSLSENLNEYKEADGKVRKLAEDLVKLEEKLMEELRAYL